MNRGVVYFVQMGSDGPIKIGTTTSSAAFRLSDLQVGNPYELRLLLQISGGRDLETRLHRELAEHRMRGEWFANVPAVHTKIQELLMTPGMSTDPKWQHDYERAFSCTNCGTVDISDYGQVCAACKEFAAVRDEASAGIDPFADVPSDVSTNVS